MKNKLVVFIHIAVWLLVFAFPFFVTPPPAPLPIMEEEQVPFKVMVTIFSILIAAMFYFNMYVIIPKVLYKRKWLFFLGSILCCYFILLALLITLIEMRAPMLSFPTRPPLVFFSFFYFFSNAIGTSIRLSIDKVKIDNQLRERDNENLKSELSLLRSQVSPHFMFNILNSLAALARKKSDQMEPAIIQLSKLMRYMLYESEDKKISVEKELDYLNSYISLQKLRFGNDVEVGFITQLEKENIPIEPMLLIPFVENAFKHGVGMISQPKIEIELIIDATSINFSVKNKVNLAQSSAKDSSSGIGLINLKRRLNILYKDKHEIKMYFTEDNYYVARLKILFYD